MRALSCDSKGNTTVDGRLKWLVVLIALNCCLNLQAVENFFAKQWDLNRQPISSVEICASHEFSQDHDHQGTLKPFLATAGSSSSGIGKGKTLASPVVFGLSMEANRYERWKEQTVALQKFRHSFSGLAPPPVA
jgi:hypothetical protein